MLCIKSGEVTKLSFNVASAVKFRDLVLRDAECGWNATKALSACQPVIAVAVPTASATTQHCVSSLLTQHRAVTQAPASNAGQQSHTDAGLIQPVTQKFTEQGQLIGSAKRTLT